MSPSISLRTTTAQTLPRFHLVDNLELISAMLVLCSGIYNVPSPAKDKGGSKIIMMIIMTMIVTTMVMIIILMGRSARRPSLCLCIYVSIYN